MSKCLSLKEDYLKEIKLIENKCREDSKSLMSEEKKDEAILENIKLNIIDIFCKMFDISFARTCKNTEDENTELKNLKEEYFKFFEKIPAPWRIKMAKDKEHNMMEEYYKEKIKLEMVDKMKEIFLKHFHEFYKED